MLMRIDKSRDSQAVNQNCHQATSSLRGKFEIIIMFLQYAL